MPAGFSGNGAYWIDQKTGNWITSTYYRGELPAWVQNFNDSKRAEKYLNREWKDSQGNILRTTKPESSQDADFFKLVGSTPFGNEYEFEFARELVAYEKLGEGPATDMLVLAFPPAICWVIAVGPDSPEMAAMALALDQSWPTSSIFSATRLAWPMSGLRFRPTTASVQRPRLPPSCTFRQSLFRIAK